MNLCHTNASSIWSLTHCLIQVPQEIISFVSRCFMFNMTLRPTTDFALVYTFTGHVIPYRLVCRCTNSDCCACVSIHSFSYPPLLHPLSRWAGHWPVIVGVMDDDSLLNYETDAVVYCLWTWYECIRHSGVVRFLHVVYTYTWFIFGLSELLWIALIILLSVQIKGWCFNCFGFHVGSEFESYWKLRPVSLEVEGAS